MLTDRHREELYASGLTDETIERSRIYSASATEVNQILGFSAGPGMALPYLQTEDIGGYSFVRIKPDIPLEPSNGGRPAKYLSPRNSINHIYIPPQISVDQLKDPRTRLFITEGEKKALKGAQEGLCIIAVPGVWAWRYRDDQSKSKPLGELNDIAWPNRDVIFCFDAELRTNRSVADALSGFANELRKRKAKVSRVDLPEGSEGKLDDYLITHSIETFSELPLLPVRNPNETFSWRPLSSLRSEEWDTRPVEWSVDKVIPKGTLGFLAGPPKEGKSLLALDLAFHMAYAHMHPPDPVLWLNKYPVTGEKVLYIAREDRENLIYSRWQEILQCYQFPVVPEVTFLTRDARFALNNPSHMEWLSDQIVKSSFTFIFFDVFNRMIPGIDPAKAADQISAIIEDLERLRSTHNVGEMVLDHTRKPPAGRGSGRREQMPNPFDIRGDITKYAAAEFTLTIARSKEHGRVNMFIENKGIDERPTIQLSVSPKDSGIPKHQYQCDLEELGERSHQRSEETASEILAVVPTTEWTSPAAIIILAGKPERTVKRHLRDLCNAGLVDFRGYTRNRQYRKRIQQLPIQANFE